MKKLICLLAGLFVLSGAAQATVLELTATDTGSMSATGTWNDDRLRAYYSGGYVDGFMKFDLSGIDNNSVINSITLTTFHEFGFSNPLNDPQVSLYHVDNDAWARGSSHPGLNNSVSGIHSGFPGGDGVAYDWMLDVTAFDWSADLTDNTLSLAMRNEKTSYSYVYWHGSDNPLYAPKLIIDFSAASVPEPATLVLFGLGLIGMGFSRRKSKAV